MFLQLADVPPQLLPLFIHLAEGRLMDALLLLFFLIRLVLLHTKVTDEFVFVPSNDLTMVAAATKDSIRGYVQSSAIEFLQCILSHAIISIIEVNDYGVYEYKLIVKIATHTNTHLNNHWNLLPLGLFLLFSRSSSKVCLAFELRCYLPITRNSLLLLVEDRCLCILFPTTTLLDPILFQRLR